LAGFSPPQNNSPVGPSVEVEIPLVVNYFTPSFENVLIGPFSALNLFLENPLSVRCYSN